MGEIVPDGAALEGSIEIHDLASALVGTRRWDFLLVGLGLLRATSIRNRFVSSIGLRPLPPPAKHPELQETKKSSKTRRIRSPS